MAFQFCDSFDATATLLQKWDTVVSEAASTNNPSTPGVWLRQGPWGRFGSGGVQLYTSASALANTSSGYFAKNITNQNTIITGFAFYIDVLPSADTQIVSLLNGSTLQCDARLRSDGRLNITRNGTSLGLTGSPISSGVWTYVEIKITIDATVGTVDVHFNGNSTLSLTNQNTVNTATTIDGVRYGVSSVSASTALPYQFRYDDLYLLDGSGLLDNDFWGDVRVMADHPAAGGFYAQFAAFGARDNYGAVADDVPDEDQSFVSSVIVGRKDTYRFPPIRSLGGTVRGVIINQRARKNDAGTRTLGCLARSSGVQTLNAVQPDVTLSYENYQFYFNQDPVTTQAWTIIAANAAEFGPEVVA